MIRAFGNLMNRVQENVASKPPQVGMGATILMFSDRYAATVTEVNGKRVIVQQDTATRTDNNGMSDSQSYEYVPNPLGQYWVFTMRKNGRYVVEGADMRNGVILVIGHRDHYHDFGF